MTDTPDTTPAPEPTPEPAAPPAESPAEPAPAESSSSPTIDVLHEAQGPAADPAYTGDTAKPRTRAEIEAELAELDRADAAAAADAATDRSQLVPGSAEHAQAAAADPAAFGQPHSSGSLEHPETTPPSELNPPESGAEPAEG